MGYYVQKRTGVVHHFADEVINRDTLLRQNWAIIHPEDYEAYDLPKPSKEYLQKQAEDVDAIIKIPDNFASMDYGDLYQFAVHQHNLTKHLKDVPLKEQQQVILRLVDNHNNAIASTAGGVGIVPDDFDVASREELMVWAKAAYGVSIDSSSYVSTEKFRAVLKEMVIEAHNRRKIDEALADKGKTSVTDIPPATNDAPPATNDAPPATNDAPPATEQTVDYDLVDPAKLNSGAKLKEYIEHHNIDVSVFNGTKPSFKDLKAYVVAAIKGELSDDTDIEM